MKENAKQSTEFFCTYKNRTTNGWRKSRSYNNIADLMDAMKDYMEKHPNTTVQYQTRTVWLTE